MMDITNRNPTELSNDINVITVEINAYQRVAGEAIFEIGKRLKHVKENDLVHGEWIKWLDSIGMNRKTAHEFIKIYDELHDSNVRTFGQIGKQALYLIATIPEDEREKEHEVNGEMKHVEDMTVKELREVKKQLKEEKEKASGYKMRYEIAEKANVNLNEKNNELNAKVDRLYDENNDLHEEIRNLEDKEPEYIEKVKTEIKEVQVQDANLVAENEQLKREIKRIKEELEEEKMNSATYKTAYDDAKELQFAFEETKPDYQKRSNSNKAVIIKQMLKEMSDVANKYFYVTFDAKLISELVANDSECSDNWNSIEIFMNNIAEHVDPKDSNIIDME